tara:strand:- start:658 stop:1161 length:504 start_codon:yes stop_codon:yes gene_type:complete
LKKSINYGLKNRTELILSIMKLELNNDQRIFLLFLNFLPNEIIHKIIFLKNEKEKKETLQYHIERWENIAGAHLFLKDNHIDKFSYVHSSSNRRDYIIKKDHQPIFYNLTGLSYQIIDLIHELIELRYEVFHIEWLKENDRWKIELKEEDQMYSELSKRLMIKMKQI